MQLSAPLQALWFRERPYRHWGIFKNIFACLRFLAYFIWKCYLQCSPLDFWIASNSFEYTAVSIALSLCNKRHVAHFRSTSLLSAHVNRISLFPCLQEAFCIKWESKAWWIPDINVTEVIVTHNISDNTNTHPSPTPPTHQHYHTTPHLPHHLSLQTSSPLPNRHTLNTHDSCPTPDTPYTAHTIPYIHADPTPLSTATTRFCSRLSLL